MDLTIKGKIDTCFGAVLEDRDNLEAIAWLLELQVKELDSCLKGDSGEGLSGLDKTVFYYIIDSLHRVAMDIMGSVSSGKELLQQCVSK